MKRTSALIIGLAMIVVACGGGEVGSAGPVTSRSNPLTAVAYTTGSAGDQEPEVVLHPVTTAAAGERGEESETVAVFFAHETLEAMAVLRSVDASAVEAETIRALLEGPTEDEEAQGLWTAIPESTLLLGVEINDGLATIDLSREFEIGGGTTSILSRLAQVVYTITQFPAVDAVSFRLDGEPVTVFSGEGVVLDNPVTRADYETVLPLARGGIVARTGAWEQGDLPSVAAFDGSVLSRVVLVGESDALAVRLSGDAESPIVGALAPNVVVARTGSIATDDASTWAQIRTPAGEFWADDRFLTTHVSDDDFQGDERVDDLLGELAAIIKRGGDLRDVTSSRGLWLSYNAAPVVFGADDLGMLLSDGSAIRWPDHLIAGDDPAFATIPETTFAQEIADPLLAALRGPASELVRNEWIDAAEQGIPEAAIPIPPELRGFNSVAVHQTDADVIEWTVWYLSIEYEDGQPRIVGITFDAWTP